MSRFILTLATVTLAISITSELHAVGWTQVVVSTPSPRQDHAMVFDAARDYASDTWQWDGTIWTQKSSTGPLARTGHGMAYDSDAASRTEAAARSGIERTTVRSRQRPHAPGPVTAETGSSTGL